jgi:hypothetical protein
MVLSASVLWAFYTLPQFSSPTANLHPDLQCWSVGLEQYPLGIIPCGRYAHQSYCCFGSEEHGPSPLPCLARHLIRG